MKPLSYLTISDIHFGHPKVKAIDLLNQFRKFLILYNKHLQHLDMIVVLGDVTDKPLLNGSEDHSVVTDFFTLLVGYANKYDIHLVLVRGTLSHDGLGLESFSNMIKELTKTSFEYIDTISIIKFKGRSMLIVPDNTHKSGEEVEAYIEKLIPNTKVDLAFIHRAFHFQLPFRLDSSLNMAYFLDKVIGYIHVGHIHKPMTYKRIIGEGSFGRLTHGQEEIKGAIVTYIDKDSRWVFLENKEATIFKRLHYSKVDVPKIVKDIRVYREGSFLEIVLSSKHIKVLNKKSITSYTKGYNITFKREDEDKESIEEIIHTPSLDPIDLTPPSIFKTLTSRVDDELSKQELKTLYKELKAPIE